MATANHFEMEILSLQRESGSSQKWRSCKLNKRNKLVPERARARAREREKIRKEAVISQIEIKTRLAWRRASIYTSVDPHSHNVQMSLGSAKSDSCGMIGVVGIDLGSEHCCLIVGKINTTDAAIPVTRFSDAWPQKAYLTDYIVINLKRHISQIKRLLGWKFSDPVLQMELDYVPFRVIEGPDGYPLVHGRYKGEDRAFTPVEILAMLISLLISEARENYFPMYHFPELKRVQVCISMPTYFTRSQRAGVLEAAKVAGLSVTLLDETLAMVRAYELYWSFVPNMDRYIVAFVDIGQASIQVCFAEFKNFTRGLKTGPQNSNILYRGYVRSLGGRDFDMELFKYFASKIKDEYNINIYISSDACIRLIEACEGVKKDLSINNEASFCVRNFCGLEEFKGSIKREDFEKLCSPILDKIEMALEKALHDSASKTQEKVDYVEAVGNGSFIPGITDILTKIFGREPRKMKCSCEYVARGCAAEANKKYATKFMFRLEDKQNAGVPSVELVSNASTKDPRDEVFHWRSAMDAEGPAFTFLNDFLEENIPRIGRSIKRVGRSLKMVNETRRLWRAQSSEKEKISFLDITTRTFKSSYRSSKGQSPQQINHTEYLQTKESKKIHTKLESAIKHISELEVELAKARKEVEDLRHLKEGIQYVGYSAEFSSSELQDATDNFHESFVLGEGGFGIVYKGILHNTMVAIKILKEGSTQGVKEFYQEIEILSKVRHPNLVTLIGACVETRALIYEYLPNGSLEDHLRCEHNTPPLTWQARVRIAFEICTALSFIHCSNPHGIVHGDLKPDNILLDLNNISKISDFGLCRQLNWTESASVPFHLTDCPKGTLPYMDPEYFSTWMTTAQYDVYSFGIILLRLATCKDPRGIRLLVEKEQKKGRLEKLIDVSAGPWPIIEAQRMITLGLRCSDPIRKNRPDLSAEVWEELKSMLDVASASCSS